MRKFWKPPSFVFLLAAGLAAAGPAKAAADNCALKLATSLDIAPDGAGRPTIRVTIAGKPKYLLVDTGGVTNMLNMATVRELGLRTGQADMRLIGINGQSSTASVNVPDFALGRLRAPNMRFMVSPLGEGAVSDTAFVGVLGPQVLAAYDADFVFEINKFNLMLQDHCPGRGVYWQRPGVPVAVVPFRLDNGFHISFPIMVDGKKLEAILDTGAANTSMNLVLARRMFELDINSPDVEQVGELEGETYSAAVYRHRFMTLDFEGVSVANPMIRLLPDMVSARGQAQARVGSLIPNRDDTPSLPGLIVGMNVLSKVHLYIAYKEKKLYISPAQNQTPASP